MKATPVDPGNNNAGADRPSYRVYFCTSPLVSEEWELSDCDLENVLSWIAGWRVDRGYSVWEVLGRAAGVEHAELVVDTHARFRTH